MIKTILPALLLCLAATLQAQYQETFSTPNKGYLIDFMDDFTGVDWTLGPWDQQPPAPFGRDVSDYFQTTATGVLESIDLDQEVCWESPLLNTSAVTTVSFSVDLTWEGFDADLLGDPCTEATLDYINVQYSVNGGPFVSVPNLIGGSSCATIGYLSTAPNPPFSGNATITQTSIPGGSSLKIRICVNTNANTEVVTIDNVNVPEQGVTLGCSAPVLGLIATPITCGGPNSGSIDLSVLGGMPGYTFNWSNGTTQEDISNLSEGTYTVTVTDATGCTATGSETVGNNPFSIDSDTAPATCDGVSDASIDLSITGGVPPYSIDWGDLPGGNDPEDRFGLEAGIYTVTVSDAGICTAETTVQIDFAPNQPYLETFDTPGKGLLPGSTCTGINATSCSNTNFAGVNWSIYGLDTLFGIDPDDHFHTIDGKLVGRDFDQVLCWESPLIDLDQSSGLPPGIRLVLSWEEFDSEPPGPDPTDLVADHIDVEYSVDGGPWERVPNKVGNGLTGHTIVYADGNGNGNNGSATIAEFIPGGAFVRIRVCGHLNSNAENFSVDSVSAVPSEGLFCPLPTLNATTTPTSCFGASDGTIDLIVSGGLPPFTFQWSNGATTEDVTGALGGNHVVTVSNSSGSTVLVVSVGEAPEIIITQDFALSSPVTCSNGADGVLAVEVSNGQMPFTYLWSDGQTGNPITNLVSGAYSVTVSDANGCTSTLPNIILSEPPPLAGMLTPYDDVLCPGETTVLDVDIIFGGTPPYQFLIDGMPGPKTVGAGVYQVVYVDAAGCTFTEPPVVISTVPYSNAMINGVDTACVGSTMIYSIPALFSNYLWTVSGNGTIESGQNTETVMVHWNSAGLEAISVDFLNTGGCPDSASLEVMVDICVGTKAPTLPGVVVAPNPVSDLLQIRFERPVEPGTALRLFDAQGRLVYEQSELTAFTRIPTNELPGGMYVLHVIEGGAYGIWKVIKR